MELDLRNPIDFVIFAVIIVVVIALIVGAVNLIGNIGSVNWKSHIDVAQTQVYGDEIEIILHRNYKSDDHMKVESITVRVTPTKGSSFSYTHEIDSTIQPGANKVFYISFDDIFDGKDKQVESFKVTKVKLVKVDD